MEVNFSLNFVSSCDIYHLPEYHFKQCFLGIFCFLYTKYGNSVATNKNIIELKCY